MTRGRDPVARQDKNIPGCASAVNFLPRVASKVPTRGT